MNMEFLFNRLLNEISLATTEWSELPRETECCETWQDFIKINNPQF